MSEWREGARSEASPKLEGFDFARVGTVTSTAFLVQADQDGTKTSVQIGISRQENGGPREEVALVVSRQPLDGGPERIAEINPDGELVTDLSEAELTETIGNTVLAGCRQHALDLRATNG
jgi:hypothetical protein